MLLTNKLTNAYFWREAGNRLFIEIDEKAVELKYTLAQNQAYHEYISRLIEKGKQEKTAELTVGEFVQNKISNDLESIFTILEIAMNPKLEKQFSIEQVKEAFSEGLDLAAIVATTWVDKKVMNPALSELLDPQLAPTRRGA